MKRKLLSLVPCGIIFILAFYLLPLFIRDTGSGMFFLLLGIPFVILAGSVLYGVREGFNLWMPLMAAVLFAPTIPIFYNESAWIYGIIYPLISLVGVGIGRIFYRKKD